MVTDIMCIWSITRGTIGCGFPTCVLWVFRARASSFLRAVPYYVTINNDTRVLCGSRDEVTFVLPSDRMTSRLLVD